MEFNNEASRTRGATRASAARERCGMRTASLDSCGGTHDPAQIERQPHSRTWRLWVEFNAFEVPQVGYVEHVARP